MFTTTRLSSATINEDESGRTLISNGFDLSLTEFDVIDHFRQFCSDDWLLDERLSEYLAEMTPLEAFLAMILVSEERKEAARDGGRSEGGREV